MEDIARDGETGDGKSDKILRRSRESAMTSAGFPSHRPSILGLAGLCATLRAAARSPRYVLFQLLDRSSTMPRPAVNVAVRAARAAGNIILRY